ncbi:hypothetical protein HBI26_080770 [Parastagonospora nodorum]|nr:hypothetical protein HBI26_080770 [Parastagonospora nodorum]
MNSQDLHGYEDAQSRKRMRHSILQDTTSQDNASSATLRQSSQHGLQRPSLLGLPGEIRNHIYSYLLPKCIQQARLVRFVGDLGFPGPTQVCALLRAEYLSLLLRQNLVVVPMTSASKFAEAFGATLQCYRSNLVVICDLIQDQNKIDILPLLLSVVDAPGLTIEFEIADECEDGFNDCELQDLSKLLDLGRWNISWRQDLRSAALKTLMIHYPFGQCGRDSEKVPMAVWLQLTLNKDYKKLWMEGTHSFRELEEFLADTGLDGLTAMDVRVGLTSTKNKGRGKGLRTKDEQKTIDWLLDRSKRTPNDVKAPPRMLKELEDDHGWQA